jgi:PKD repeat protein
LLSGCTPSARRGGSPRASGENVEGEIVLRQLARHAVIYALGLFGGAPLVRAQAPSEAWRIQLDASRAGLLDKARLTLGGSAFADAGYDTSDDPHPPTLPGQYLDLVTRHAQPEPGWETQPLLQQAYRAEHIATLGSTGHVFDLHLETDAPGPVFLSWRITPNLELARYHVAFRDAATGSVVDMWTTTSYSLSVGPGTRQLRVELTPGRVPTPVAYDITATTAEETALPLVLNAQDAGAATLAYTIVEPAASGTLLGLPPNVTYVPNVDFNGTDTFAFRASNGQAESNIASVSISVTPVNDAPVAHGRAVQTDEDVALPITVEAGDVDGDSLTIAIATPPAHGTLSGAGPAFTYTPASDFSGDDSFVFAASDGQTLSAPATVALAVRPVNDPPRVAITVPGPPRNAATLDNDVASYFEGASIVGLPASSAPPAIDENAQTFWVSANGQTTNQSLTVALPRLSVLDRIRLVNGPSALGVKRFEVRVSTTSSDPAAFTTVLSGVASDQFTIQEFVLPSPAAARFVQLLALDNHGSTCCIAVKSFEAISDSLAGVPAFSSPSSVSSYLDPNFRPELAIDGLPHTAWRTKAVLGQHLDVRLDADALVDRVRVLGESTAQALRDFDVLVSETGAANHSIALQGTYANNGRLQEFVFPGGARRARYVRLVPKNNHGAPDGISVASFEVVTVASEGNLISANASLVAASSTTGGSAGPAAALDADPAVPGWFTTASQPQWLTLALPSSRSWLVDHVALQPRSDCCREQSPRRFEVQTSSTTPDASAFTTVLEGTLRNNGTLQHFFFNGVNARFVRLLLLDNYGGTTHQLQTFGVYSPEIGALAARFEDRSVDVDGGIGAFEWSFGDGGGSNQRHPAHAYASPGLYDVTLEATDDASLAGSRTQTYQAVAAPQAAFAQTPPDAGEGAPITFSDTSADPAGITLRDWDFGDGKPRVVGSAPTTAHAFDDDGSYVVTLRVTNSWGVTSSATRTVVVSNRTPTVEAGADRKVLLGQDWGVFPVVNDPGPGDVMSLRCRWDFGDGQSAEIPNCGFPGTARVPHVYTAPGSYVARLTVTDKNGASAVDSITVGAFPPECVLGGRVFLEFPYCGSGYSIAELGAVPTLPVSSYGGVVVNREDPDQLLLATSAITSQGAIYSVGLARDEERHITGFSAAPVKVASVPYIDGGLTYGPEGVLFTAAWPTQQLIQIEPGSSAPSKVLPLGPLGVSDVGLNFVPRGFPGACSLKFVNHFNSRWWSSTIAPDGSGTYTVSPGEEKEGLNALGGPEHLLYVPEGSSTFPDRSTVLVTEYGAGNIVAYTIDGNGDPIPSTRTIVVSGFNAPEAMAVDPLTGDLLVTNLDGLTVKRVRGLRPPVWRLDLAAETPSHGIGQTHTVTATVSEPRAGVHVNFTIASGPNVGAEGSCAPNPDCTTDTNGIVRFNYAGSSSTGTDMIQASIEAATCDILESPEVSVDWGANRPPAAESSTLVVDEDAPAALALVASDPDGDTLGYEIVSGPQHGMLSGEAPSLLYSPAPNYHGTDFIRFVARDGQTASAEATVEITVRPINDAPDAQGGSATTNEDTPVEVRLPASDADLDPLQYAIVTPPVHGTLSGNAPNLVYTPEANEHGPDSFVFQVSDGQLLSAAATVTLAVHATNDVPVAADQSLEVIQARETAVTLTATDVDGDALSYTIVIPPAHGTLGGAAPNLVYTSDTGYTGVDAFAFQVNDGQADSNVAAVSLSVVAEQNHAPHCSQARAVIASAWPPNHKMASVQIAGLTDHDGDELFVLAKEIRQDEAVDGLGDGDRSPDGTLTPLQLRVERSGTGNGRIYRIAFEASDADGASCTGTVSLCVPHDGDSPSCVDDGAEHDSTRTVEKR